MGNEASWQQPAATDTLAVGAPPWREADRLATLRDYDIVDTAAEPAFDDIAELTASFCQTPVALISLVGDGRQWFKAERGLGVREMPVESSICARALRHPGVFVITDTLADGWTATSKLAQGDNPVRFYASAPLIAHNGLPIGMLCVLDRSPRRDGLAPSQARALAALSRQVMAQMELRRTMRQRDAALADRREAERRGRTILDSAVDYAVLTFDPAGLVTSWNEGARRILEWSDAEILGQSVARLYPAEDAADGAAASEMADLRLAGHTDDARWYRRKSGERFWATGQTRVLTDADGAVIGFLKILRDRTTSRRQEEALLAANTRLELALDAGAVIGCWTWDVAADRVTVDQRLAALFGIAAEQGEAGVSHRVFRATVHHDDLPGFVRRRNQALRQGGPFRQEYRLLTPDGPRWVEGSGRVDLGPSGSAIRAAGVLIDITERKRADAERESLLAELDSERARLQALLDHLPVGIVFAEAPAGRVSLANPQLERITGMPLDSLADITAHDELPILRPDGTALPTEEYPLARALLRGETTGAEEYRFRRGDGSETWLQLSATPIRHGAIVTGGVVSVVDIGDKKATEHALRDLNETLEARVAERTRQLAASETRFRALIEHAPDMIALVRVDDDGDLVYEIANPAIADIAGLTPAEMVGRSVASSLPPGERAILKARFTDCITTGRIQRFEMASDLGSGPRILDSILVPMPAASPDTGRRLVLVSARDITAHRHTEDALRQSQKMEAVGQLTGGLAHDFNNLLAGITGSLDLISKRLGQGRTAEIGRFVEAAMGSAKRAAALTHRLLAFSRRQTLDPRPTDVARLATAMEELIGRSMGPGITVETQMTEGLWTLCDPNQLESALLNLAINARDAMPDGGRLTISAANATLDDIAAAGVEPGTFVAISVADTGTGMSPEVMARVFEPFFTTKPLGQGTGLGLSMVYGFARQSGGHVRIESREDVGTVVRLYLPHHKGGRSADAAPPTQTEDQIPAGAATVLVVDDEPVVRMLVCEVLSELGYVALEAHDGPEGLRILGTDARIDLLVTDVGLPGGINGRQLADAAQVLRPELKVLFITGYAETAAIGDSQLAPGMEVVTKPFELAALAGRIRGMMEA